MILCCLMSNLDKSMRREEKKRESICEYGDNISIRLSTSPSGHCTSPCLLLLHLIPRLFYSLAVWVTLPPIANRHTLWQKHANTHVERTIMPTRRHNVRGSGRAVCACVMTVSSLKASPTQASDNTQINTHSLSLLSLRMKVEDEEQKWRGGREQRTQKKIPRLPEQGDGGK